MDELVEDTNQEPEEVKNKKPRKSKFEDKYERLEAAVRIALTHYENSHRMKTPDDYTYPGFKEIWAVLNS